MATGFDGSIRINTKIDGSGFDEGIANIGKSLGKLNSSLGKSLSNSLGNAGSAAEKAAKDMETAIAPFDEFNILAFSAASNVGGAGAGGEEADFSILDIEDDIEDYEALEEEFDSLADLFVKMLDDMLAAMPDFRNALLNFAKNFNDFNKTLYDAFKDPRVIDRVEELGRQLAYVLNDLVKAIDWEQRGRTLGAGLNLGLQFLTEFLYNRNYCRSLR